MKKENNDKIFQKNIQLWSQTDPKIALMLPYTDCSSVSFCKTKSGELNLKKVSDRKTLYYHSNTNAAREAQKWFSSLDLNDVNVLYIYGAGLGYYYEAAKKWLRQSKDHFIVFLEDDKAVLHRLLETNAGTQILKDKQVQLYYFKGIEESKELFEMLYWDFVRMKVLVTALKHYNKHKHQTFFELQRKMDYDIALKNALVDEYLNYGIPFYKNFYPNILQLAKSYFGNRLFGKFNQVPAIICGAGPSLNKNLSLLKTLTDRAIIFAGGSAINALNDKGVYPHLGAGIDPNAEQYKRISLHQAFETPYIYRNRVYHGAFRMIHGPRLYITGTGGYDVTEWFEEKFDIKEEFLDEGHNVVNFCLQAANAMGCNPIIFVGVDLAFTGMQAYAGGVVEDATVAEEDILKVSDFDAKAIMREDIYGKPVYTLWKWIAESHWIGDFAKEHPKAVMINATEGGLGFPGIPNVPLATAAEKLLTRTYNLRDRIHGEIVSNPIPNITPQKILDAMIELRDSLHRCVGHLNVLLNDAEQVYNLVKDNKEHPSNLQTGRAALAETELADEPGYLCVLDVFNALYASVLKPEIRKLKFLTLRKREMRKLILNSHKFHFLMDAARINAEMIEMTLRGEFDL